MSHSIIVTVGVASKFILRMVSGYHRCIGNSDHGHRCLRCKRCRCNIWDRCSSDNVGCRVQNRGSGQMRQIVIVWCVALLRSIIMGIRSIRNLCRCNIWGRCNVRSRCCSYVRSRCCYSLNHLNSIKDSW